MKKFFLFLAACAMSIAMSAAVSITINPSHVDFGEVSIKGKTSVEGSATFDVTYSGLVEYCGVVFEDVEMPEDGAAFWIEGTNTSGWIYSGDTYTPAEGKGLTLHYMADKAGTYTGKIRFYSYNSENDWYNEVPGTPYYMTMKLVVTDEAIVAKTTPFERINSTSELKDGDEVVFVDETSGAVSAPLNGTYLPALTEGVKVDKATGKADVPAGAQTFILKQYSGNWQFIYPDDSEKALLLDYSSNSGKGAFSTTYAVGQTVKSWEITISGGVASVIRPNEADPAYPVRFNSDRFKPYKSESTGTDIALYKKSGEAQEIKSSVVLNTESVTFSDCELVETQSVEVSYTAENLTDDIVWAVEGTDAALFEVKEEGDRKSGKVTVTYKGTGTQTGAVSAQLSYLTQNAKLDPMEGSFPISLTLIANTVKLTKIAFVGAPETIDQHQTIDMSQYLVFTPSDAVDKSVTWSTDHDYQGTIDADGKLYAKQVTGQIIVTVTSVRVPEVSANHTLTITVPTITDFTLSKSEVTLYTGGTETMSITAFVPDYATATATWASSNTEVATVSKSGVITAKAIGEAEISATIGEVVKTCQVHVVPVTVESIAFATQEARLTVGTQLQLTPTVTPAQAADDYTITYVSDNEETATVSTDGVVKGIAEGDAVIIATIDGKSAQITIHVVAAATFAKLTNPSVLAAKDTIILAAIYENNGVIAGKRDGKKLTVLTEGVTVTETEAYADEACRMVLGTESGKEGYTLTIAGASKPIAVAANANDIVDANTQNGRYWEFVADGSNGYYVRNLLNTNAMFKYHIGNAAIKPYKATTTGAVYVYVYYRKYVAPIGTDIEEVQGDNVQCTKVLRDGRLMIIRNGVVYTVDGKIGYRL